MAETKKLPTQTVDTFPEYKDNIDASMRVHDEVGGNFAAHEAAVPDMTVIVDSGKMINGINHTAKAQQTTSAITAPTTNPRIDRIAINVNTGTYVIHTGTEAASPVPPIYVVDDYPVCQIALSVAQIEIENADITDERALVLIPTSVAGDSNIPARNTVLTKDALSQPGAAEAGFSACIYTGDGAATKNIASGLDMTTGLFGGLVWIKNRDQADAHILCDTVRGIEQRLSTNSTAIEVSDADTIKGFISTGFTIGADVKVNTNAEDYIAWSFQTNQKKAGVTNRNKAYTAHYNPQAGFSIVGFVGDGVDGHEIPHHLGVKPELSIFKNRDTINSWLVKSPLFSDADEYLYIDITAALATLSNTSTLFSDATVRIDEHSGVNNSADNIISYHFASVDGVSKVGKYIGTGAAGNYVNCGFKPAFVMIKRLDAVGNWDIHDTIRTTDERLQVNTTVVEITTANRVNVTDTGFILESTASDNNSLDGEYIFLAFAESSIDGTKALSNYTEPTAGDELAVANPTRFTFADGFDSSGQVDAQEQVAGATLTFGAGHESKHYYLYRDNGVGFGQTEVRPLTGLTRDDADKYGEVSPIDATLRTTDFHYDYEAPSGSMLASSEFSTSYAAPHAFNKDRNDITSSAVATTLWLANAITGWLQYKHSEKRILKSWRIRDDQYSATRRPKRFTIEGSNDGYTWTEIDATYKTGTGVDYTGNGQGLWSDLQDTSANTTAYLYHRIDITENNGDATYVGIGEFELNTKIAADYFLADEGEIYNDAGTGIERVYYGECITDANGYVISFVNYAAGRLKLNEAEVYGDLMVHGNILSKGSISAFVTFDSTKNPPLIHNSYNVKDIVDGGTGFFDIIFETPMDDINYIVDVSSNAGNNKLPSRTNYNLYSVQGINTENAAGSNADHSNVCVIIHGGKKILGGKS